MNTGTTPSFPRPIQKPINRWVKVSKKNPCSICGHTDWCGFTTDGQIARCMRIASPKESVSRDGEVGYIHQLIGAPASSFEPQNRSQTKLTDLPTKPTTNTDFASLWRRYADKTHRSKLEGLADRLGVSIESLKRLRTVWCFGDVYGFPMVDIDGRIIGLRLRGNGSKFAAEGSSQGLFIPEGVKESDTSMLLICEGPTDTAAALTLGFDAIGRPSCKAGVELIKRFLQSKRDVVIVADNDTPKPRNDGSVSFPGWEGAEYLASKIIPMANSCKIITPNSGKDLRQWVELGASKQSLLENIAITFARGV